MSASLATARELAHLLGVSKQRVHQLTQLEGFPAPAEWTTRGRRWRVAEVEAWRRDPEHQPRVARRMARA